MSAFIVRRDHIDYLVAAATSVALTAHQDRRFSWHHDGENHELSPTDASDGRKAEVGQMLWDANVRSVFHRYPDMSPLELPGPTGECYVYEEHRDGFGAFRQPAITPVQVLKAVHCYRYQSCEHPEWEGSEAHAFCEELEARAVNALPGMDDAQWEIVPETAKVAS